MKGLCLFYNNGSEAVSCSGLSDNQKMGPPGQNDLMLLGTPLWTHHIMVEIHSGCLVQRHSDVFRK